MTKTRTRPAPARRKTGPPDKTKTARTKTVKTAVSTASHPAASDVLRKHAERLRKSGAHAMRVKPGAKGPVIEVFVPEDFTGTLPSKVAASIKGKSVDVPITIRKAPRFKAEKL